MLKKSKKGLSQLDWIISLTLFMFYLVWFFVYAVPTITPPTEQANSYDSIYDNFMAETEWNITKMPLVFISNISGNDELLYVDMPYSWSKDNMGFSDQRAFALEEGKIFFLGNITNSSNIFYIANSDSIYSATEPYGDITSTSTKTTMNSMSISADFASSLMTRLQREQNIPIDNMSFYIDDSPLSPSSASFSKTNISAKYTASTESANISTYLFSKNYRILTFIYKKGISNTNHELTMSATIRQYPYYRAHNEFAGTLDYTTSTCSNVNYNIIHFYSNTSGLTFILPENSKIVFCTKNNSFTLNITMNLTNSTFQIIPYVGNYNNSVKYASPYSAEAGMKDISTGLSVDKLAALNSTKYSTKRTAWNFKGTGDFTITVTNSTSDVLLDFGTPPHEAVNAYVAEKDWWILDKNGNQEKAVVNIRTW